MNTLQTPIDVLDKMVALNLNINLWSARKKITFEDVDHIPNGDLPPHDLATLGSKKIAPPESLRIFTTLKARASNMLDRYGVRFMSGWAIPENLVLEVMAELEKIRDEFNTEKEKFLNEYDNLINDWVNKHIQNEHIMKSIPLLAAILGNRYGIEIIISGDSAMTDGNTIYLPALPLDCDDTFLCLLRGFCRHSLWLGSFRPHKEKSIKIAYMVWL